MGGSRNLDLEGRADGAEVGLQCGQEGLGDIQGKAFRRPLVTQVWGSEERAGDKQLVVPSVRVFGFFNELSHVFISGELSARVPRKELKEQCALTRRSPPALLTTAVYLQPSHELLTRFRPNCQLSPDCSGATASWLPALAAQGKGDFQVTARSLLGV